MHPGDIGLPEARMKKLPAALFLIPAFLSARESPPVELDPMVVTASGLEEPADQVPSTLRKFDAEEINASAPRRLMDFLQQESLSQILDFGPAHATMIMRGAATLGFGQGWNDSSEIAVLINGRPAGTANLGKISTHDIESVEILHGPNSVLYGSSAAGGVINLITKNGANSPEGTSFTTIASSFDRYTQILESSGSHGAFDWYLNLHHTNADDYKAGGGRTQPNTAYEQRGATLALGWEINPLNRLDFTFRQDGLHDAGHPGATYSLTDRDDRYGTSLQLDYSGSTADERFRWKNQLYWVRDVDKFHWSQDPLIGLIPALTAPVLIGTPGITRDFNKRELQEWGNRFSFEASLSESNKLTAGIDLKTSEINSDRIREAAPGYLGGLIGIPVVLEPLSIDSRTHNTGVYLLDSQTFLDGKLKLSLGGRYEHIRQEALRTKNSPVQPANRSEDIFLWQAGAVWKAADSLTFRGNLGTGYVSANPTFLYGSTIQPNGFGYLPNPDLKDEKSFGWDIGGTYRSESLTVDLSFFQQTFEDYITAYLIPGTTRLQWRNADERHVRGLESVVSYDLAPALGLADFSLTPYFRGTYNFSKKAVDLAGNSAEQAFMPDWSLNAGIRAAKQGKWSADLYVTSAGASEVNAGYLQNANVPPSEITANQDLPGYTTLNFSASWQATENLTVFCGVNNILDRNYSPYFVPLNNGSTSDVGPWLLPGTVSGEGMSSPGREFFGGLTWRF